MPGGGWRSSIARWCIAGAGGRGCKTWTRPTSRRRCSAASRPGIEDFARQADGSFRGWLWGITRHKLADHFRRQSQQPRAIGGSAAGQRLHELAEDPPEDREDGFDPDAALLHRALDVIRAEFEPTTWQAFWRTVVESQRPCDIADELGLSKKAVRQAKYRVLKRLRSEMQGQLDRD